MNYEKLDELIGLFEESMLTHAKNGTISEAEVDIFKVLTEVKRNAEKDESDKALREKEIANEEAKAIAEAEAAKAQKFSEALKLSGNCIQTVGNVLVASIGAATSLTAIKWILESEDFKPIMSKGFQIATRLIPKV